ncbi:MAG TPA: RdgB/HAM1 family non-canonical purine NTP pyrophosphatase [Pyrinomonadaceae bacterium]|nr:RdgB/HAM1 family non-canonical purine NTP pyrophosphatase [Pyrinomonadaceae bacterium]
MILPPTFEILIATHNKGKLREVHDALHSLPVKFRYLSEFPHVSLVKEIGRTYEENAVLKALSYARQTGMCALADDSGLEVDALGGGPGVHSARFGGESLSDRERMQKLLAKLSEEPDRGRNARFVCCIALAGWQLAPHAREPRLLTLTEAKCEGSIALRAQGTNGFGFDPVFIPKSHFATFAELPKEVKAKISHRAQALAAIRTFLSYQIPQT